MLTVHERLLTRLEPSIYLSQNIGNPFSTLFFFFNDTATPEISPLPLHDALPISPVRGSSPLPPSRCPPRFRPRTFPRVPPADTLRARVERALSGVQNPREGALDAGAQRVGGG